MVNVFFGKTLARLILGATVLIGPLEYALHVGTTAFPERSNAHYIFNDTCLPDNVTCVPTFVPSSPMCKLPPAQPYVFQLGMNGAKITTFAVVLGGAPDDLAQDASQWKVGLLRCMTFYQWVMVPLTMVLSIGHFCFDMGPFESFWRAYECFGILWTLGPWWFNVFLVGVKALFQEGTVGARLDNRFWEAPAMIMKPLVTQEEVERVKGASFWLMAAVTVAPYLLVWSPYVVTHLIPALVLFAPQNLLIVGLLLMLQWIINVDPNGKRYQTNPITLPILPPNSETISIAKDMGKAGGLHFLPMMAGMAIIAEILVLEATYLYAGDGYFGSMAEAWLERRSDYYFKAFAQKVLGQLYAFTDLANEAT